MESAKVYSGINSGIRIHFMLTSMKRHVEYRELNHDTCNGIFEMLSVARPAYEVTDCEVLPRHFKSLIVVEDPKAL